MKLMVRDWLPKEALDAAPVRAAVAGAVDDWSSAWFGERPFGEASFTNYGGADAPAAPGAGWLVHRAAVAIGCAADRLEALVGCALGAKPGQAPTTEMDRELFGGFAQRLIGDLAQKVEQALRIDGAPQVPPVQAERPLEPLGGLAVELPDGRGRLWVALAIPLQAVVRFLKAAASRARPRPGLGGGMGQALRASAVVVEAVLGEAELALAELRGLAPGDVIVLDASVGRPAMLTLAGGEAPVGRGSLGECDGRLSLTLEA